MTQPQNESDSAGSTLTSWEDDGGCAEVEKPNRDLNSLLATEQTSIIDAEAAATPAIFEALREESLQTRQLINATYYPQHQPHVFAQERARREESVNEARRSSAATLEKKERLLARQFSDGKVSAKAFENRTRFLRQDRARIFDMPDGRGAEENS